MKKLLSVVLSALLLMTSFLCVSAVDAAPEIKVTTRAFEVLVDVTTDATEGRMTAILRNKANNVWIDMDQTTEYTVDDNGNSVYSFSLMMQPTTDTGLYTVTVGGNVDTTAYDFKFTNINSVISYYNTLDEASASEIHDMLHGEDYILTYDLTAYKAIKDEDVCELVDAEIASWDLATDMDTVSLVETFFTEAMDDAIARAIVADENTETEDWASAIEANVKAGILETDYMDKVDAEVVHTYFKNATLTAITAEDIQKALDEAQLLAIADDLDFASLNDAFDFYLEKGIVNIDDEMYEDVCAANKADNLFKELKKKDNATITDLENNVDAIAEEILDDLSESSSGSTSSSGGSSGGGGGGIGRPSSSKNTTGNTMMSGDAAETVVKKEETVYSANFSDLGEATWAASSIKALAEKGIVSGRGDGKFYPNDTVTREEFVKIIVTAFDALDENAAASFDDVATDRWSYKYIATANRLGLVTGLDDTTFNPTGIITREDMAVIMHRAMKLASVDEEDYSLDFADADEIAGYAKDAVAQLSGKKIINGMGDGTFAPKATVTRAQAAKVVYELLALIGGVN